ncbi:uncharacterized protein PSFLO_04634 [Pseudozyma flocculosa]|uniref:Uncharacterized protein n=1 Tax=Pseudozyma flocculosa TaxID=84751 RepID=A0A5C3F5E9_9BASI|nr:uncharacterized protein PSFLO_04634 [Pseudozyma flocculosa]
MRAHCLFCSCPAPLSLLPSRHYPRPFARHRPLPAIGPCQPSDLCSPPPPNRRQPSLAAIGPINLDATNKHLPQPFHPATIDADSPPPPTPTRRYCQRQLASTAHTIKIAFSQAWVTSYHQHASSSRSHRIDTDPGLQSL